jgi:hypothetical protein
MKHNTEQLLDDLLEDAASPEFRAALLDKTLRSSRRRKQARRFNMAMSVTVVAGIFLFSFWRMREPATAMPPAPMRQPDSMFVNSQPLQPLQIVSTQPHSVEQFSSSAGTLAEVRTSRSAGPYLEINDRELFALLPNRPAILVHLGLHQSELMVLNPGN